MVTNKEIEESAEYYADKNSMYIDHPMGDTYIMEKLSDAYKAGAKWAANKFLQDLWHPASEEPRKDTMCLIQMKLINGHGLFEYTTAIYIGEGKWTNIYISDDTDMKIIRWLYIDDLIVKN